MTKLLNRKGTLVKFNLFSAERHNKGTLTKPSKGMAADKTKMMELQDGLNNRA